MTNPIWMATLLFTRSMPRITRQIFVLLLFGSLFLAANSAVNQVTLNVQAIQSVHYKHRFIQVRPKQHTGHVIPSWGEEKRTHKNPSGPNPVGNYLPPTKP